jgi:4-amino-4-deoxychorismate lyase
MAFKIQNVKYKDLKEFDEMFLMNSVYGITPVKKYDDVLFKPKIEELKILNNALKFIYEEK